MFAQAAERGRKLRTLQMCATVALVGVIAAFVFAIYANVRSMYTAENFHASLEPQIERLQPQVEDTVRGVVDKVGPHYARLGRERLEKLLPQVQESLGAELVGLTDSLARRSEERVSVALERVRERQFDRLRERFPELDESEFAELRKRFAGDVQGDTTDVLADFHDKVMVDLANLNGTIETFGPNKYDDFERDALVRYYAHLWLTLVDEEILSGELAGGRDG